jgi:hypothetical protein
VVSVESERWMPPREGRTRVRPTGTRLQERAARRLGRMDDGAPEPVRLLAQRMATYGAEWALCGGWAVDAWVGRPTREHHDVDVVVFHDDQRVLFEHVRGWSPIGHDDHVDDDSREPWVGRRLDPPAHVHSRPPGDAAETEFHLVEREGGAWLLHREPRLSLPLADAVRPTPWGVRAVTPLVALFAKAVPRMWRDTPRAPPRPQDEMDFPVLSSLVGPSERTWLVDAIGRVDPRHPWLPRI